MDLSTAVLLSSEGGFPLSVAIFMRICDLRFDIRITGMRLSAIRPAVRAISKDVDAWLNTFSRIFACFALLSHLQHGSEEWD